MERIFSSWITYDPNIKTSQETCSQKWWYLELRVEPLIKVWLFWWHMCPKKICDVLVNKVLSSISLYNNWHNVYRTQLRCIVRCTWIENVSATIVKIVVCLPVISLRSSPSDAYYASASVFTRLLICKYSVPTKKKRDSFAKSTTQSVHTSLIHVTELFSSISRLWWKARLLWSLRNVSVAGQIKPASLWPTDD